VATSGTVLRWRAATGEEVSRYTVPTAGNDGHERLTFLHLTSDGRKLLGVRHQGGGFYASPGRANQVAVTIHGWDVATRQALPARHLTATGPGTDWAGYSCLSADGRSIAIPGGLVCDTVTGRELGRLKVAGMPFGMAIAFSPDGALLAAA